MHLNELKAAHSDAVAEMEAIFARTQEQPSAEDEKAFQEAQERADKLSRDIARQEDIEARKAKLADAAQIPPTAPMSGPKIEVGDEEPIYREGDAPGDPSYFRDLVQAHRSGNPDAQDRLRRSTMQTRDALAKKRELRDLSRTDTTSVGEFVPPAWLLELYEPGIRASNRVTANLCRSMALPGGTDSLNIPKITTNPTVAAQTSDNATVNEVDTVTGTVAAPVQTFAGQNDVAMQVLEQSPLAGGFDRLIFDELTADLDRYVDVQVLNGTGANGQVLGILGAVVAGNKSAYTDASPTQAEMYPSFGKVISLTTTAGKRTLDAIVMHNRRWYWLMGALDSSNRPYVTPVANGPNNAYGIQTSGGNAEGLVGFIAGLPVYIDPNVPVLLTNGAGAAGTEDIVVVGKFSDALLFEGNLRTRVLPEVLSGTLTVRLQVYEYAAFTAARAGGNNFGTIYDTGMAAPSGY